MEASVRNKTATKMKQLLMHSRKRKIETSSDGTPTFKKSDMQFLPFFCDNEDVNATDLGRAVAADTFGNHDKHVFSPRRAGNAEKLGNGKR